MTKFFPLPKLLPKPLPSPSTQLHDFLSFPKGKKGPQIQTNKSQRQAKSPKPKQKLTPTNNNNNNNFKPNQIKTKQEAWNSFCLGQLLLSTGLALKSS